MWHGLLQAEPGKSVGRYNCGLTLTVYPQQQVVLTPQDVAELGRKDMVLLWKVCSSLLVPEMQGMYYKLGTGRLLPDQPGKG